jgi:hypothetical protein
LRRRSSERRHKHLPAAPIGRHRLGVAPQRQLRAHQPPVQREQSLGGLRRIVRHLSSKPFERPCIDPALGTIEGDLSLLEHERIVVPE